MATSATTALLFTTALVMATLIMKNRPASTQDAWRAWTSTNLANLSDRPISSLVTSAFLVEENLWVWAALSLIGLAAAGRVFGNLRAALLVGASHGLGTAVSEGILAYRIHSGAAPTTDRYLIDIGPSYVVVCALVAAIGFGTWPGRLLSAAGFAVIAPYLFIGLRDLEVSSVGHACSVVVGLVGGYLLHRTRRRTGD